ncbi:hypothetical protein FOC84_14950 [Achromobacter pestifer]|uniref:Uncharacterized protein n=1 Tax=Achromobacter pestifer TaxID=1353889 RepID=A0A7D4HZV3_9BURK|nr:hypothetical protein [Achromobacter pestifer]QKH36176.1 hypothetical protein FOC84_14950 [Achromobacter pestifer]
MDAKKLEAMADEYLFGGGLLLSNFYIEKTPVGEVICFVNDKGRHFDLPVSDPILAGAVKARLNELGVKVVIHSSI